MSHGGEVWAVEGTTRWPITQGGKYWGQPDVSPDGSRVALIGWGASYSDLFVLDTDTQENRQLTQSQGRGQANNQWVFRPRWSPDGQLIAYLADRTTEYALLWTVRPDGTNARQLTPGRLQGDAIDAFSWSPDGSRIAATRFTGPQSQIHIIDAARPATSRVLTTEPGGAYDPSWSPDGRYIAYAAREGRNSVVKVIDLENESQPYTLVQSENARSPAWAPSGKALAYLALSGPDFELFVVDITSDQDGRLNARRPSQITSRFGVDATSGLSWGH